MRVRVGKILRGLGLALLGLVLLLALLWVLRVPLFGGLVKGQITDRLEAALGGRYEIEDIGGTWWGGLSIEGLRTVESPPDGPLMRLEADRAEVEYDLLGLLGDAPLEAIDTIRVDGARVELDAERFVADSSDEPLDLEALERFRGRVDVAGDLVVDTPEGRATARGLRVGVGGGRALELAVDEIVLPERLDVRGPLAAEVRRIDADTWRWTSETDLGGVRIAEATIHRDGRVEATVAVAGGRILATFADDRIEAKVEGIDFAQLPDRVVALFPDDVERPSAGVLSGSFTVSWRTGSVGTFFDLEVVDLVWREEKIRRAAAAGASLGAGLQLATLEVAGDRVRASGREISLDLEAPMPLVGARALSVDVDSLRSLVPDLVHDVSVSLEASGAEPSRLTVHRLLLRHADDRLEATGEVRFPDDPAQWRKATVELEIRGEIKDPAVLELPWTGAVRLEGRVAGALESVGVDLVANGEAIAVEGRPIEGARLVGTLDWPAIDVATLEVRAPGVDVQARGRVGLEPIRFEDAAWRITIDDLERVAPIVPTGVPALAGRLQSNGQASWNGKTLSGSGQISASGLRVDGEAIGTFEATLVGDTTGAARVESFAARGPWGRLEGGATFDVHTESATIEALAYAEAGGTSPRAALRAPLGVRWDGGDVRLVGLDLEVDGARVRLDASVRPEDHLAEVQRLEVEHPDLRLRLSVPARIAWQDDVVTLPELALVVDDEARVLTTLSFDLREESATVERLGIVTPDLEARLLAPAHVSRHGEEIVLHGLDAMVQGLRIRGAGRVRPEERVAVVEALRVQDEDLDARLQAAARLAWTDERVSVEGLDVLVEGGRVHGSAAWDGAVRADLEAEGFALQRWVSELEGSIAAKIRVDGERIAIEAEVPELVYQDWRGAVHVEAAQDESGPLAVRSVRVRGPRGGTLEGQATLPWRVSTEGLVDVEGMAPLLELRGQLGGLDLFTDVADGPVSLTARGDAEGLHLLVRIADVGLCDESRPCDDVGLDLRVTPEQVRGRVSLGSDAFLRVRGHLDLDRGFDWTRPTTIADLVSEATIDAEIDALVESWTPLASVVPGLRRLEGGTRLRLKAAGPLRSPTVDGELTVSQLGIELDTELAPFEQVDARFVWSDDVIRVEKLEGLMGYAPFSIQGEVRLRADALPEVDLTVHGRNTQLIRTEWFRMRIDIDGRVTGPVDQLNVAGEGRIVDSIYREPVSLTGASGVGDSPELILFQIEAAPFDKMTFDLGIRADRTIRIRNNLLGADLSFEGRLKGKGARPAIEGRVTFDNAEIRLPLTTLRNGSGEVEFLAGSPGRPRIQMTAHTRTGGYEMGVQVAGRLPDVNLHVFTEPPLDDEDAMLLLATGSTGAELAQGGILGKGLAAVASIFGGSLFTSRNDEGELGQKAFFERFEVSADLDGTVIRELDAQFELNRRFYLHVKRDRFEATNLGLIWRLRFR